MYKTRMTKLRIHSRAAGILNNRRYYRKLVWHD